MKKIVLGLSMLLSQAFYAQDFEYNHSLGITYLLGIYSFSYQDATVKASENGTQGYPGITYNPRLDLKMDRELSLSFTSYPTLCLSKSTSVNSRAGASSEGYFAFELPTGVQLNFGNHSTSRSRKDFGGFIMAGYNYGFYSGIGSHSSIATMAGCKFYIREQNIGIRLEYNIPLGLNKSIDERLQLFAVGLLYNLER